MELANTTPYPAHLFRTSLGDDRFAAAVIVRVTYDISSDGTCRPASEQSWPVSPGPWECEYGKMEGDDVFVRGGVDLLVFGSAHAPGGAAVRSLEVSVSVGRFTGSIWVFGDRYWQDMGGQLRASEPEPFTAMPLTLERAFGGTCDWDGLGMPFPENPEGRGFYFDAEMALGQPLPNIENPTAPITSWADHPSPVGVACCPPAQADRIASIVFDDVGRLKELRPRFFNSAFPAMVAEIVQPFDTVTVAGVTPNGPLRVTVPDHALRVRLEFDEEVIERRPAIDQIGIEPERARAFVTYRHPFRYTFHPLQRRSCALSAD